MAGPGLKAVQASNQSLGWAQFRVIAWLRWRILANSFRRRGSKTELVGRVVLLPFLFCLGLLPTVLAGGFAWTLAQHRSWTYFSLLFWSTFALTQLLNINLGQPGTTFDPTELIRFPMAFRNYVLVRLCFGLLSPANVMVTLMSAAIFAGVTYARPTLWPWTLGAAGSFALTNVLFSRMLFAWVDRWLSTRRAREIFTALIFAGSLLFQYINLTYNPGFQHHTSRADAAQRLHHVQGLYAQVHRWLGWLPPELAGSSIRLAGRGHFAASLAQTALVAAYGAAFLLIYSLRMRAEYLGENLSDQANAVRAVPQRVSPAPAGGSFPTLAQSRPSASVAPSFLSPYLGPLFGKELRILRRNTGLLYGVVAPVVMVFLFAGRLSFRGGSHWLLLIAVGYGLLGLAPMSYNSFGLEGAGAQFYFMAPVPLRDVFFAKNLMQLLLALFEVLSVVAIVAYVAGRPRLHEVLVAVLWAVGALLLNTTLGNLRSVAAPKKVNPGRSINRSQSQVSAWIAIGVLAACAGLAFGVELLAEFVGRPWLSIAFMAFFAGAGLLIYWHGLKGIGRYAMERRESLFEELGKKT